MVMTMAEFDVDLFVIGGGSGGVRAARIAAGYGAKVAVAEEYRVGGTCVIRGCVPKKLFVYASHFAEDFKDAAGFGWNVPPASFDWPTLIANKDKEIARLEAAYASNLAKAGAVLIPSRAVIEDAHTVRLTATGKTMRAKHILIATGAQPNHGKAIPGIEHVISSNEAFWLETFPKRILIQGGGYIAVEFAGIFAGLGADVTLVYRGENILRGFDNDVRTHLRAEMENHGINIVCGATVDRIEKHGETFVSHLSNGSSLSTDQVMFAIGRHPNIANLGLENVGIAISDKTGGIKVDDDARTNVPSIYAVGDVTNRVNLTPVAIREGHAFADNVFGGKNIKVDHADIPTAVFSQPEVGTVGLSEEAALAQYKQVDIYRATFRPMKATLSGRDTKILMKLVVDAQSDRVLGCHIVGDGAGEMIQLAGIAIRMKATKADFDCTVAVHPSAAEELVTMRTPTVRHGQTGTE